MMMVIMMMIHPSRAPPLMEQGSAEFCSLSDPHHHDLQRGRQGGDHHFVRRVGSVFLLFHHSATGIASLAEGMPFRWFGCRTLKPRPRPGVVFLLSRQVPGTPAPHVRFRRARRTQSIEKGLLGGGGLGHRPEKKGAENDLELVY